MGNLCSQQHKTGVAFRLGQGVVLGTWIPPGRAIVQFAAFDAGYMARRRGDAKICFFNKMALASFANHDSPAWNATYGHKRI
jgi:hypothetical protein